MTKVEEKLDTIIDKLNLLIKLMAMDVLHNFKTNRETIKFLTGIGLQSSEIITITDIPSKTVYNVISDIKKGNETHT